MSEAELHILKARMHEGRSAKAARGELVMGLPRGFVMKPSGEVALDPDEEVQSTIRLVFAVFDRRRSVNGLPHYLVDHDIQLPDRIRTGARKGEVRWNRPNRDTLDDILRHPTYAGAYVYGQRNQEQMAANRTRHGGVPRGGPALLGGLLRCGRCGRRMYVTYKDDGHEARYVCCQLATTFGGPRCQSVSAGPVDALVAERMLEALAPSAIEVSLQVAEDLELEREQLHEQWQRRLERAAYETALARRRYEAVDPHNRLVTRTLERDWEAALEAEQAMRGEYERACTREPMRLSEAEKETVRHLAADVPAIWRDGSTTPADRQMIARTMLERITLLVVGDSEMVEIECLWAGGMQTRHRLVRPVRRFEQLKDFDRLLARLGELRCQGLTADRMAERLNAEGWHPAKRASFNAPIVR